MCAVSAPTPTPAPPFVGYTAPRLRLPSNLPTTLHPTKWACRADNAGVTPLLACCAAGHLEATRFLVEVMGLAIDRTHLEAARAADSEEGNGSEVVAYLENALP